MKKELQWWLYILNCEEGRYYVGIAYDLRRRITSHIIGKKSAVMTKLYTPISVERVFLLPTIERPVAEIYENVFVLKLHQAKKKVSGGIYVLRDDIHRERIMTKALETSSFKMHGIINKLDFKLIENITRKENKEQELNNSLFDENGIILIKRLLDRISSDVDRIKQQLEAL